MQVHKHHNIEIVRVGSLFKVRCSCGEQFELRSAAHKAEKDAWNHAGAIDSVEEARTADVGLELATVEPTWRERDELDRPLPNACWSPYLR